MKRFIIHKKRAGTKPAPCEIFQYDRLAVALQVADKLHQSAPEWEYVVYDKISKHYIK